MKKALTGRHISRKAFALTIMAAVALHLFAVAAVLMLVHREAKLAEYASIPVIVTYDSAEAFAPSPRRIIVTIDDGPSADTTPVILDVLARHGVKAIFFPLPVSDADERLKEIMNRIISEGHIIGNHTYSHDYQNVFASGITAFREDVEKMNDYLASSGITPELFRFPGGASGRPESVLNPRREILSELGLNEVNWDISFGDDSDTYVSAETMYNSVLSEILEFGGTGGITILLHDSAGNAQSAAALDMLLTELKSRGYIFE